MNLDKQLDFITDSVVSSGCSLGSKVSVAFKVMAEEDKLKNKWTWYHKDSEPLLFSLGGAFALYTYMRLNVNRWDKPIRNGKTTWARLDEYYNRGYLVFAQHQRYLSKEYGKFDVTQGTISNWLKRLEDAEIIVNVGQAYIKRRNESVPITVYALGEWRHIGKKYIEVFYFDALTFS